jgi:hypothetical protein
MRSRSEQYRQNGEACLALAVKSRSEEDRKYWRSLAQGWFDLEKHTEDHSLEPAR